MEKGSDLSAGGNLDRVYRFQWHGAAIKAETRVFDRTCLTSARQSPSPQFSSVHFSLLARASRGL